MEVLKKESKFNYIIFLLILSHFLFGFLIQENAGGGKIDEIHVLNNLKLFESISFLEINWLKYDSSSLPLFYIIYNFLIDTNNYSYILYLNLIVSIFSRTQNIGLDSHLCHYLSFLATFGSPYDIE